jgi:LysM repeat protein
MSRKFLTQVSILVLFVLVLIGTPISGQAGGVCGGTYVVDAGDTVDSIAARCGTSASAIYAANPGISGTLYAGQVLILPGSNASVPSTPIPTKAPSGTYYVVQPGDTFSGIASRYGLSLQQLWAANPYIQNINVLYVGQVLYIPPSSGSPTYPVGTPATAPVPLSYGTVPAGTKYGNVSLVNKSFGDVYVSLQGTTRDGTHVIREYPVRGSMTVKVPAAWYVYVAWVGGVKYEGQFNLGQDGDRTITFYDKKVTDG